MVKSIVSMLCVAIIIGSAILWENHFIKNQFGEFNAVLNVLYDKVDKEVATQEDVYAVQKNWLNKKKYLHILIPHTEIKEIDLWLSEAVTLVRDKQWEDAISKIEVLTELCEQIPKTFSIAVENIF